MGKTFKKLTGLAFGLAIALGFCTGLNKNEVKAANAIADGNTEYRLITSTDELEYGASYIITSNPYGIADAISTESNDNNRKTVEVSIANNSTVPSASVLSFTLEGYSGAWNFATENYLGEAGYLNPGSQTSKNYLFIDDLDANANFSISFSNSAAVITCTSKSSRNIIRYNFNNGSPIFSCYSSGCSPIYLFKEVPSGQQEDEPSIQIDDDSCNLTLDVDDYVTLTATTANAGEASISWSSSDANEDIIMVDSETGEVMAVGPGTTTVFASISVGGKTYRDSTSITVREPDIDVDEFIINEENDNVSIFEGTTVQLTTFALPSTHNENFTWASSDNSIATVDDNGVVTGVSEGSVIITATTSRTNLDAKCIVRVFYQAKYFDNSGDKEDTITISLLNISGNGYQEFKNKSDESGAVYGGKAYNNSSKVQLNANNSAIWTTVSGGVFKSISVLGSTGSKNLEVYGSNSPFDDETSTTSYNGKTKIVTLNGNGTAEASEDYRYIFIRTDGSMAYSSISIKWANNYAATIEDMKALEDFVDCCLSSDIAGDYDPVNNQGSGKCISEGWYNEAKGMFNTVLSEEQRMLFMSDNYYAEPRARLEAWAVANGDNYNAVENLISNRISISNNSDSIIEGADSTTLIVTVSAMASAAILGLYLLKKKKEN